MAVARAAQIYGVYRRPPTCFLPALGPRLMRVRHAGVRTIPHTLYPLTLPCTPGSRRIGSPSVAVARVHRAERPTALHCKRCCMRGVRLRRLR